MPKTFIVKADDGTLAHDIRDITSCSTDFLVALANEMLHIECSACEGGGDGCSSCAERGWIYAASMS